VGLKFKCPTCRKPIVSGYLKRGETMACPYCGALVTISDFATETDESPSIRSQHESPLSQEKVKPEFKIAEREDLVPICPHCEASLNEIYTRTKGFPIISADNTVYFCPHCLKVLGFGKSRMG
jgi:DNA-directed RNA polymerase subunit M/transcription elongation factor TFIIS